MRNFGGRFIVMLCLVALPTEPGAAVGPGPIEMAIAREARRLADQQTGAAQDPAGWARITALEPGTEVLVVVRGGGELDRRFVSADDTTMLVSAADGPAETVARADVVEVTVRAQRRGSVVAGLVAGGLTFTLLGLPIALDIATNEQCQPACGWAKTKVALSLVALPVGAGYAAYKIFGRRTEQIIYRAP